MDEKKAYTIAIEKYEKLCEERDNDHFWSENIIDASVDLKSAIAWQNFYIYLSDSTHQYEGKMQPTLGESIDDGSAVYPPCDVDFDYVTVQNGNITHIKMTPKSKGFELIEDEKKQAV